MMGNYINLYNIVLSVIYIIVVYGFFYFISKQIRRFKDQDKLGENIAFIFERIIKWGSIIALIVVLFTQFGIKIDLFASLMVLMGGTIIGFAAMNTLGNAIAGIILMTSSFRHRRHTLLQRRIR